LNADCSYWAWLFKDATVTIAEFSLPLLSIPNDCLKFLKENRQIDRRLIYLVNSMIFVSEEAIEPNRLLSSFWGGAIVFEKLILVK
jgi:hypothetical protein